MNTAVDNFINTLEVDSEIEYYGRVHVIQSYDSHDVEILEKWEWDIEESMTVTWWDIMEEYELQGF